MKKVVLFFAMIFAINLITISCSQNNNEAGEMMHNENGMGEAGEGNHSETGNEQGESGKRWAKNATADETLNGIRAIITFNASTNTFEGTFQNLNTNVAQQTRLEVHIFDANGNSTEYGPTPGVDMQPNETRNITLSIPTGTNFVEFAMHPEVGTAGSGG
ncbi:hypothetical protein F7018_03875 [Tenacibaculum aiptasiae]|uniref:Uncharacterized protein n=1 Tax=Tenacibaculum aiptasiae TaxID=426481 RepID=A0A7J5APF9_9FLAO|nr:hypothetical protein [Tenacibaculum aiptasiae]KAB1159460.1 hypothetical protein F7018_03875 [Tenacibaculum aiptasiae]